MTLGGWRSHIAGALTLLKARGAARCTTAYGRELVIAVREQVVCTQTLSIEATDLSVDSSIHRNGASLRFRVRLAGTRSRRNGESLYRAESCNGRCTGG